MHIMEAQTLIDFNDEEEKLTEIIPDVVPKEKKPLVPPTEIDEVDDEEDYEDECE